MPRDKAIDKKDKETRGSHMDGVRVAYILVQGDEGLAEGPTSETKRHNPDDWVVRGIHNASGTVITSLEEEKRILLSCPSRPYARYTTSVVTQCLQCLGCKARRSRKVCHKIFWLLTQRVRERCDVKQCVIVLHRKEFERVVMSCLGEHPQHMSEHDKLVHFQIACRLAERKLGLIVLLYGTSGTGKSTLASLVASRLGICHVMSTDAIRNVLRGFDREKEQGYLWSSTYEDTDNVEYTYMKQRSAILKHVESLVDAFAARNQSIVIEGVHLSGAFAVKLMKRHAHATVVPFLVHISNKEKHLERFAVRAKAMTLRPEYNRYVKHLESIRHIQHLLQTEATMHGIPLVDNTNVDRSLNVIHTTILGVLSRASSQQMDSFNSGDCFPKNSLLDIFKSNVTSTWKSSVAMEQIYRRRKVPLGGSPTATSFTSTLVDMASEDGGSKMMDDSDHDSLGAEHAHTESMIHGSVKALSEGTKSDVHTHDPES